MNWSGPLNKKSLKIFYSHPKTDISKKFLYFYQEIEISIFLCFPHEIEISKKFL